MNIFSRKKDAPIAVLDPIEPPKVVDVPIEQQIDTLELLKSCPRVEAPKVDPHISRLCKLRGEYDYAAQNLEAYNKLCSLKENPWIIDTEFIKKFKYHATVIPMKIEGYAFTQTSIRVGEQAQRQKVIQSQDTISNKGSYVRYVGDIPEFALDRIEQILAKDNKIGFTIHSNQPLPVKLVKIDPVLIAWTNCPGIYTDLNDKTSIGVGIGIVVAIWDMDKEIL
jgi:hypothetical protein